MFFSSCSALITGWRIEKKKTGWEDSSVNWTDDRQPFDRQFTTLWSFAPTALNSTSQFEVVSSSFCSSHQLYQVIGRRSYHHYQQQQCVLCFLLFLWSSNKLKFKFAHTDCKPMRVRRCLPTCHKLCTVWLPHSTLPVASHELTLFTFFANTLFLDW